MLTTDQIIKAKSALVFERGAIPTANYSDENFRFAQFRDIGALNCTFERCDFRAALFKRAYFKHCKFIECNFTGARFDQTTIRGSNTEVEDCDFDYLAAHGSVLPTPLLLRNLPGRDNVKLKAAQALRKNAQSVGDYESAKEFFVEEMAATAIHLGKARRGKEKYYAKHYPDFSHRVEYTGRSFGHWISGLAWAHGSSPWRLGGWLFMVWLTMSGVTVLFTGDLGGAEFQTEPLTAMQQAAYFTAITILGLSYQFQPSTPATTVVALLDGAIGYVALGTIVAVGYNRLARK